MAETSAPGQGTGKPLIERDRVEGTTVLDRHGHSIGSIKRLMIEKIDPVKPRLPNRTIVGTVLRACRKAKLTDTLASAASGAPAIEAALPDRNDLQHGPRSISATASDKKSWSRSSAEREFAREAVLRRPGEAGSGTLKRGREREP